jgi:adenylate kinase
MKKIICLYGQPGSGKTTQADLLVTEFGFTKFGMGERLRAEVESKSSLGLKIKPYLDKGILIPDESMTKIISDAEKMSGEKGIIFDGFPRMVSQAKMLDEIMHSLDLEITAFIYLRLSPDDALARIKTRAKLDTSRSDDINEEAIKNRFLVFEEESISLLDFYQKRGLLIEIDGGKTIEEINKEIIKTLQL